MSPPVLVYAAAALGGGTLAVLGLRAGLWALARRRHRPERLQMIDRRKLPQRGRAGPLNWRP